ncbi:hydrogenase expression protein [Natronomonas salina]|uniref:AIR synthase family protein n=1 Tax=Natronomonas salina TaxID=1710540 RepID=UPI0015B73690|nr:AIR synthase family protein [Natronomonas salina]QLD90115.1 hydrogenase expression protein [Natronomonas salina]
MDTGKVSRAFFEARIAPKLGAERDDVALGPTPGVDFGVVSVGEHALVTATDPVSILPDLGWERAGRFAVDVVLSDVAVSGVPPTHLTVSLALPPELSEESFGRVWDAIDAECRDLGVSIVTGHTASYAESTLPWVGAATGIAVGDPDDIIRPDGARPGDDLLVTKGPAVEAVGLLTTLFADQIDLPAETLSTAQARVDETGAVRDALTAAAAGDVHAMHDATEGGLLGALHEVADSAGVRLAVESDAVPMRPGVRETCEALGMDPWRASTAGTLVVAVDPADTDRVVAALEDRGTPVGVAGRVDSGSGVVLDGEETARPDGDSGWPVYDRLLAASESDEE